MDHAPLASGGLAALAALTLGLAFDRSGRAAALALLLAAAVIMTVLISASGGS